MNQVAFQVRDRAELAQTCENDALCLWVAQGMSATTRAWRSSSGDALVVARPNLARRDRIALYGDPISVAGVLEWTLATTPSSYRVMGPADLVAAAAEAIDELLVTSTFGWMERHASKVDRVDDRIDARGVWLEPEEMDDVATLLDAAFPDSYARPGVEGVESWSGYRKDGRLAGVAACAWSAPEVGFIAGVAAHPDVAGTGAAAAAFAHALNAALGRGAAALMVTAENQRAIDLYRGFGLTYRPISVAAITRGR